MSAIIEHQDHTDSGVSMTHSQMLDLMDTIAIECGRVRIEAQEMRLKINAMESEALSRLDVINNLRRQVEAGALAIESVAGALGGLKNFSASAFAGAVHERGAA